MEKIYTYSKNTNVSLSAPCLVCEEPAELTEQEMLRLDYGHYYPVKICSKCKEAILRVREISNFKIDIPKVSVDPEEIDRYIHSLNKHSTL